MPRGARSAQKPLTVLWRHPQALIRGAFSGVPRVVIAIYLASTLLNLLAFNQGDLNHTVGSSYAYLFGHVSDFYDYNQQYFRINDYYPTVYLIFAAWMAPVKLLVSPGQQNATLISSWEVAWGKSLLFCVFIATVYLVVLIARELFPNRPEARRAVHLTYLLSPFAAFAFNVFGQYDVIGVFFTLLGFLYYLRGDKWRFALFFALAASCKYFALLIFAPLLLLQYKKFKDVAALSAVAVSVIVLEAALYLSNSAFREQTLFGLAGGKLLGDGQRSDLVYLIAIIYGVLLLLLWRARPSLAARGALGVHSAALAYGLLFLMVAWNPQWFMILTPFYALAVGFLNRPSRFLVWESIAFLGFIWYVVNLLPGNVDVTMVRLGSLRSLIDDPRLLLSDIYPASAMPILEVLLMLYLLSPAVYWLLEFAEGRSPDPLGAPDAPVKTPLWVLRVLTLPLVFTLPAAIAVLIPTSAANAINPAAPTMRMDRSDTCAASETPYAEVSDASQVVQAIRPDRTGLSAIAVHVGTYGRELDGAILLTLRDAAGREVERSTTELADVHDNSRVYAIFEEPIADSGSDLYSVEIRTTGVEAGAGIALWGSSDDCVPDAVLTFDGAPQPGDLNISLFYARD